MFKIKDIIHILKDKNILIKANLVNDSKERIREVLHDTRRISLHKETLYIAIKGENFDGHDFIKEIDGITAVISQKDIKLDKTSVIVVKDTVTAYGVIANYWKKKNRFKLIAISGSNGKTTTKEMLYHILKSQKLQVFRNPKNFNNLIGVPYSILLAEKEMEYLIIEFGMNQYNEIKKLSEIADPDYGYLTNVGTAHIGFFDTKQNILKAKTELYDYLIENNKIIFLNESDECLKNWDENHKDYKNIMRFEVNTKKISNSSLFEFKAYNLKNALSALGIAAYFDVPVEESIKALKTFKFPKLRSNWFFIDNFKFFIDCYNANYDSMTASLEFISEEKPRFEGRRVAVLGDMNELGNRTEEFHKKISEQLKKFKIEQAFFIGKYAKYYQDNSSVPSKIYKDLSALAKGLKENLQDNDIILLKASRTLELEKVLDYFKGE